jgi:hypothetical protein
MTTIQNLDLFRTVFKWLNTHLVTGFKNFCFSNGSGIQASSFWMFTELQKLLQHAEIHFVETGEFVQYREA